MIIHLRIIEASDIPKMDADKTDAYCIIQLIPQSNYKEKTTVQENSLSPYWNQEFHIPIDNVQTASLYLSLYDKDDYRDDIISTLVLPLSTMKVGHVNDQWYPMIPAEQVKKAGLLHLVTHLATADAQPFLQLSTNDNEHTIKGGPIPGMYPPGQLPQQIYQNQTYPQQQAPYPQQQQQAPYQQSQVYPPQQAQIYPQLPNPYPLQPQQTPYIQQQPYPPQSPYLQQQPYGPQQQPCGQPYYGQPYCQPAQPYQDGYDYDYPLPPRPPGMNDDNYHKLKKAQKKIMKKIMKGDIEGGLKKGLKYFLKM